MKFYASHAQASIREKRLIGVSDFEQFGKDISNKHIRADGAIETIGTPVMVAAATVGKIGDKIAGTIKRLLGSKEQPRALPDGHLAYLRQGAAGTVDNAVGLVKNAVNSRPGRALGNLIEGAANLFDMAITNPILDTMSAVFNHVRFKRGKSIMDQTRKQVSDLQLAT